MAGKAIGFDDFLACVSKDHATFVTELHEDLRQAGCHIDVKEAKSGYVVSYAKNKKTVVNYIFRKKGLMVRLYPNHIQQYMVLLDSLPDGMIQSIKAAPLCKRLLDPDACNPKCAMGYDFLIGGERVQKCRYNACMFVVCEENKPFIKTFLQQELASYG